MQNINVDSVIQEALNGNWSSSQHGITLFALVCSTRSKKILETGVREGGSTIPLLLGAAVTNGHVTSIDRADPCLQVYGKQMPEELQKYWTFVKSDTIEFFKNNTETYDLVFLDDWHASEHLYQELTYVDKFATKSTLIVLHDLMHTNTQPNYNSNTFPSNHEFGGTGPYGGVVKFCNEYPNYEYATIPVNHGLTILRKIQ